MLTGFATRSQMIAAVVEAALAAKAARKAGKAVGVARVLGKGAGKEVPWSGGLSRLMAGLLLVEVRAAGNGMMMIPASGEYYATRNGWPQLLLPRLLLPLGLVRRLRGSTCSLALGTVNKNSCFSRAVSKSLTALPAALAELPRRCPWQLTPGPLGCCRLLLLWPCIVEIKRAWVFM